jgi:hypothetical protein
MGKPEAVGCARLKEGKDYLLAFCPKACRGMHLQSSWAMALQGKTVLGRISLRTCCGYLSAWDRMYGSLGLM